MEIAINRKNKLQIINNRRFDTMYYKRFFVVGLFSTLAAATAVAANTGNVIIVSHNKRIAIVSTQYLLSKTIRSDRVIANFRVFANGDNYNNALQRVTAINNGFVKFVKKLFGKSDVKTTGQYGYSKTAAFVVSIDSSKIDSIHRVLRYIAGNRFPYKTGITTISIRFAVSDKLKRSVRSMLFKESIIIAKGKLAIINKMLGGGYTISKLHVGYGAPQYTRRYEMYTPENNIKAMSAGSRISSTPQLAAGSVRIKANVELEMGKEIGK